MLGIALARRKKFNIILSLFDPKDIETFLIKSINEDEEVNLSHS